ncbi:hypothetical protein Trydic_g8000 [Trypoxylus dichotomus]
MRLVCIFIIDYLFVAYFIRISLSYSLLIPVSVKLIDITDCPIDERLPIHTTFFIKDNDDGTQSIYGNASLDLIIDDRIVMRVLRLKMSPRKGWIPDKIYMRDSSFCKIADSYFRRTTETALGAHLESFCPTHRGSYQFYDFAPDFKGIQFPVEMLGYVKLRIELERLWVDNYSNEQREMAACNEIELASSRPKE